MLFGGCGGGGGGGDGGGGGAPSRNAYSDRAIARSEYAFRLGAPPPPPSPPPPPPPQPPNNMQKAKPSTWSYPPQRGG